MAWCSLLLASLALVLQRCRRRQEGNKKQKRRFWIRKIFRSFSCLGIRLYKFWWLFVAFEKCHSIRKQEAKLKVVKSYSCNLKIYNFKCFFECVTIISSYFIDFKLSPKIGDRELSPIHFDFIMRYLGLLWFLGGIVHSWGGRLIAILRKFFASGWDWALGYYHSM